MNTLDRVIKAIHTCKEESTQIKITAESNLQTDIGIDSLDTLMLVGELEEEFDIEINQDEFSNVYTVNDIVKKLEAL